MLLLKNGKKKTLCITPWCGKLTASEWYELNWFILWLRSCSMLCILQSCFVSNCCWWLLTLQEIPCSAYGVFEYSTSFNKCWRSFFMVFAGKSLLLSGVCQLPLVLFACCLTRLAGCILPSRNIKLTLFSYSQEKRNLSFAMENPTWPTFHEGARCKHFLTPQFLF